MRLYQIGESGLESRSDTSSSLSTRITHSSLEPENPASDPRVSCHKAMGDREILTRGKQLRSLSAHMGTETTASRPVQSPLYSQASYLKLHNSTLGDSATADHHPPKKISPKSNSE